MRFSSALALATLLSLGACGSSQSDRNDPSFAGRPGNPGMGGGMMRAEPGGNDASCPLQLQGTTATVEDVDGGVAIRFTTTGDVAELRRRVTERVAWHTAGPHPGMGPGRGMGQGGRGAGRGAPVMAHQEMMAADARVEEVEGGARMVFTPPDPARLEALRSEVRAHAAQMTATGQCPMMIGARTP